MDGQTGFYPYQTPITAYGNGGFRFADMSHKGSLLCLPTGMQAWDIASIDDLSLESLKPVLETSEQIDVLFIGTGNDIVFLDPLIRQALRQRQIIVEAIATGGAVRTYNVLLAEQRSVAAALIAVERAR